MNNTFVVVVERRVEKAIHDTDGAGVRRLAIMRALIRGREICKWGKLLQSGDGTVVDVLR